MPASVPRNTEYDIGGSSFRNTPLEQVRTILMRFVQGLFSAAPMGDFHWNADDEKTEIIIRDENPIHVEKYGQRPCISFTIGNIQFHSLGLDDMLETDLKTGRKTKGVIIPGTTSINVCSRNDIEAHNLAWIVGEHIWLLRDLILRAGFFEIGRGLVITPPSPPGSIVAGDSADEWYVSTVSVPWQFSRKSSVTPLGRQIVNNIILHIQTGALNHIESMGPVTGIGVSEYKPESFASGASDIYKHTPDPAGLLSSIISKQPHPLNPAKTIIIRSSNLYRAGLKPASMNGRPLPIVTSIVEESESET